MPPDMSSGGEEVARISMRFSMVIALNISDNVHNRNSAMLDGMQDFNVVF